MWTGVEELRAFYESGIGLLARRHLRRHIRTLWPDVKAKRVLGLGYATPYLGLFRDEAERAIALMPQPQGAVHWPKEGRNLVGLAGETQLPLPDRSMDRILLVHAVEVAESLRPMLREVWRVLADDGELLVVAPSRRGLWARLERTPFGHGRPFSDAQMARLLRESMFSPGRVENALFFPPFRTRLFFGSAPAWERIGARWFPAFAGVTLTVASKELAAGAGIGEAARARRRVVPAVRPNALRTGPGAPRSGRCRTASADRSR